MLDYAKTMATLKAINEVFKGEEFTTRQYKKEIASRGDCYATLQGVSHLIEKSREEYFDLPETAHVENETVYTYNGQRISWSEARTLKKIGLEVLEEEKPVQGVRYYYVLKPLDKGYLKRQIASDRHDAYHSMCKYEELYNGAKKRLEALNELYTMLDEEEE